MSTQHIDLNRIVCPSGTIVDTGVQNWAVPLSEEDYYYCADEIDFYEDRKAMYELRKAVMMPSAQ